MRHYFDSKDFLKLREVTVNSTPGGPIEQVADFSDYKPFGGVQIPMRIEQSMMGQSFSLGVDKCEVNTKVQDALFVKPAK